MQRRKLTREQVEQLVREARERKERPNLRRTSLSGANLREADLSGAVFSGTNLVEADLREADLSGADLRGADLRWANLRGANLVKAVLRRAYGWETDLTEANLFEANLIKTDLRKADLSGAVLSGADFREANLWGADLRRATLTQTKLASTNFSSAILEDTSFIRVDLSQAKGLTEVNHQGPSIIDINTIYQSKDKIPAVFLERAGVHPDIIRWQHNLHTLPTVFICYSHQDEREKDLLVKHLTILKQLDLIDIWDDTQIEGGAVWEQEILQAITRSSVAILLVSANFLTSNVINTLEMPHFLDRHARDETFILYPIIIKPCPWEAVPWLQRLEVRPKGGKPIWSGKTKVDIELSKIATEVIEVIKNRWRR